MASFSFKAVHNLVAKLSAGEGLGVVNVPSLFPGHITMQLPILFLGMETILGMPVCN
jgi:hypothetical protein